MLRVENIKKYFWKSTFMKNCVKAVDGVSFTIGKGETLGLVGESGCGKSTLARIILKLLPLDEGKIYFNDLDITKYSFQQMQKLRREMQIVFQHPDAALNPRKRIRDSLLEPVRLHKLMELKEAEAKVNDYLNFVGLNKEILNRYPHQVSGGQIQRIALARALILGPKFLVLDEPTSMLDVSVQAQIIGLLKTAQEEFGISYLFISHDIDLVKAFSERIAVMCNGKIVEIDKTENIYHLPRHPYSINLMNACKSFT